MNICVFGASSPEIGAPYLEAAHKLGVLIAKEGHTLIFGGGAAGIMGESARGAKSAGGRIVGIVPRFINADGVSYPECDELITTETMRERKAKMEELADAFIVCPGGIGTFEELFEMLSLKQLERHRKAIVILNTDGYYNGLELLLEHSIEENFVREVCRTLYSFVNTPEEAMREIAEYVPRPEAQDLRGFPSAYTFESIRENE